MPPGTNSIRPRIALFKLPLLVSEEIFRHFESIDLLELSTVSKRAATLVHNCKVKAKPVIDLQIWKDIAMIKFHIADDGYDHDMIWWIGSHKMPRKYEALGSSTFQGTKRTVTKNEKKNQNVRPVVLYLRICRSSWIFLDKALKHLTFIFPHMQVRDLVLDPLQTYNVKVGLASLQKVKNLRFNHGMINNKLKFVIENVTVTEKFNNYAHHSMGCGIQDKIDCSEEIYSMNSTWMSPAMLSKLNCRSTRLLATRISAKDVEAYLQEWIDTDKHSRTEIMEICMYDDGEQIDFEKLGATTWNPNNRPEFFNYQGKWAIDCSEILDIMKYDGTIASIAVHGDNTFVMYVWPKNQEEQS